MFGWLRTLKTPSVLLPLFAILSLLLIAVTYYLFWVRTQSEKFNDRAFRKVAVISDTLSSELKLYRSILDYGKQLTPNREKEFLRTEVPDLQVQCSTKRGNGEPSLLASIQESGELPLSSNAGRAGCISLTKLASDAMGSAFPGDLFDEILIVTGQGTVLFQSTRTGLRITDLKRTYPKDHDLILPLYKSDGTEATLQSSATGPGNRDSFEEARGHSELADIEIAGTSYRVYLSPVVKSLEGIQPIQIPSTLSGGSSKGDEQVELVVAGLVRTSRFRTSTFSPPKNMTIWALLILSWLVIGLWPPLRFAFTNHTDRIRAGAVLSIFLMNALAGAVLALMIAHKTDSGLDDSTDEKLKKISAQVEMSLDKEVHTILKMACVGRRDLTSGKFKEDQMKTPGIFSDYPYFDHMEVDSTDGKQLAKLTLRRRVTPNVDVTEYTYFKAAKEKRFWLSSTTAIDQRFRLDPFYSPTTGKYLAILSQPFSPGLCPDGGTMLKEFPTALLLTTVTRLISLTDPVLPPDFGFMILDRNGTVLFHSDSSLNLHENFFDESEGDPNIRQAVEKNLYLFDDVQYHGDRTRVHSQPVGIWPDCPWTIVSFRNLSLLESRHIETMLLCITLLFLYATALVVFLTVLLCYRTHLAISVLRPAESAVGLYVSLSVGYALLFVASLLLSMQGADAALVVGAFAIPFGVLLSSYGLIQGKLGSFPVYLLGCGSILTPFVWRATHLHGRPSSCWLLVAVVLVLLGMPLTKDLWSNQGSKQKRFSRYSVALTTMLFIVSGIPSLFLYQASFDFVQILFRQQELLSEYTQLEQRAQAVQEEFSTLNFASGKQDLDIETVLATKRRLDITFDQYQDAVNWQVDPQPSIPSLSHDPELDGFLRIVAPFNRWLDDSQAAAMRVLATDQRSVSGKAEGRDGGNEWVSDQTEPGEWRLKWTNPVRKADALAASRRSAFLPLTLWARLQPSSIAYFARGWHFAWLFFFPIGIFVAALWQIHFTVKQLFAADRAGGAPFPVFRGAQEKVSCVVFASDGLLRHAPEMTWTDAGMVFQVDSITPLAEVAETHARLYEAIMNRKRVTLVCTQLPTELLEDRKATSGAAEANQECAGTAEWSQLLNALPERRRIAEEIIQAPENSRFAFEAVWNNATLRQRVAIFQLAHDGMVNPDNVLVLSALMKRGIVVQEAGVPRLFDKFATYVRMTIPPETAEQWKQSEGTAAGVRLVFLVLTVAIIVVGLLFAQQQVLAAILAGLSPLVPFVSSLLTRGKERGSEP